MFNQYELYIFGLKLDRSGQLWIAVARHNLGPKCVKMILKDLVDFG